MYTCLRQTNFEYWKNGTIQKSREKNEEIIQTNNNTLIHAFLHSYVHLATSYIYILTIRQKHKSL